MTYKLLLGKFSSIRRNGDVGQRCSLVLGNDSDNDEDVTKGTEVRGMVVLWVVQWRGQSLKPGH